MTEFPIRRFTDEAEIVRLGEGLLVCSLERADWTHEAHLAATLYLLTRRPDVDLDIQIAGIIARFNESVGGVNDDAGGYHDTITRIYLAGARLFLRETGETDLLAQVNALLASPMGHRDWPLRFYTREQLFSVPARRGYVAPDLAPLAIPSPAP